MKKIEINNTLFQLGFSIRNARRKIGWSQERLAFEADIDRSYMGGIERGERNISILTLYKISYALGTNISNLTKNIK